MLCNIPKIQILNPSKGEDRTGTTQGGAEYRTGFESDAELGGSVQPVFSAAGPGIFLTVVLQEPWRNLLQAWRAEYRTGFESDAEVALVRIQDLDFGMLHNIL